MTSENSKKLKFKPKITRVKLNPEQAVLSCGCYADTLKGSYWLDPKGYFQPELDSSPGTICVGRSSFVFNGPGSGAPGWNPKGATYSYMFEQNISTS